MSWKKIFCGALAASMIFSASVFAAPEDSANAKLAKIETDTYGIEQSGAMLDRISRLEKNYSGQNMTGNMNARIDLIYNELYDNNAGPGILAKINALEWNVNHEVQSGGVERRLTALENTILGSRVEGTFNERIRALAKASYGEEILPIVLTPIPENLLIKVATTVPVGSKTLQAGDTIPIKVVEDVFVDGNLVFANGLPGEGVVVNVHRAKNIFSNGKIEADFHALKAIDGQDVKIFTGIEAVDAMTADSMARGLSLLGQTFSGKNKSIEEVLVRGKNIDLPAGVELYVQIKTPIVVYGVNPKGSGNVTDVTPDEALINTPAQPTTTQPTPAQTDEGLSPEEMNATPPPPPQSNDDQILVQVDKEPTAQKPQEPQPSPPRPEEGKTLEGYDGPIVEIFDEE
ncbi:MAG: hypothetical protein IJR52_02800 [Selenomonadaceae bacterium]|nr:hypothetical protein [Selenomonadaceae bacterium]MBQ9496486.1 hypothetical protein [Selenomonadaceae bacterium]